MSFIILIQCLMIAWSRKSVSTSQKLLRYTFLALIYLVVVSPSGQLALFCHQTDTTESLSVLSIMFPEGSRPNGGQEPQVLMT
jgi:hypothetical protein